MALACLLWQAETLRVVDGDTFQIRETGEYIRLLDIDTPELTRARCPAERDAALRAAGFLDGFIAAGEVRIERGGRDIYARTLARISVNGRDAGTALLDAGLAREWPNGPDDWCSEPREP